MIKNKVKQRVFENLKTIQQCHSKIREICYETFKIQDYMKTQKITNHEVTLLFALRSKSVRSVATNFGQQKDCSLGCKSQETQEHWIVCSRTKGKQGTKVTYNDKYGGLQKQLPIVKLFALFEQEREELSGHNFMGAADSAVVLLAGSSSVAANTGPRP